MFLMSDCHSCFGITGLVINHPLVRVGVLKMIWGLPDFHHLSVEKTDLGIFLKVVGEDLRIEDSRGTMAVDLGIGTGTLSQNLLLWQTTATEQLQFQDQQVYISLIYGMLGFRNVQHDQLLTSVCCYAWDGNSVVMSLCSCLQEENCYRSELSPCSHQFLLQDSCLQPISNSL